MLKYNHKKIEKKWQNKWDKSEIYKAEDFSKKKKYYCLIEFPYPSGAGLHVGHLRSHIAIDIVARQKRMSGYNVMYPIGWDAFGLPTENFAIKTKTHPKIVTENNIKNFTKQIKSYGPSFDWSREINTTDPKYYKWTQWIFLKLFNSFYDEKSDKARDIKELEIPKDLNNLEKKEFIDSHRLAYEAEMAINWCPSCKIGLANEEVVNNACERCGASAEKKTMKQWMLKITKYANRLIRDLDTVDYLEKIKTQQVNWIGKSEGATVKFQITNSKSQINSKFKIQNSKLFLEVFTTRPDTLFGCTYMVLAPEHNLIEELKLQITNCDEVEKYILQAQNKSDLDRTDLAKEKTGVELKGIKAINPANNEEIPIWVADYVLATYGTGAIMAVPAHDERDFEFAKKFGLEIKYVIEPNFVTALNFCFKTFELKYGKFNENNVDHWSNLGSLLYDLKYLKDRSDIRSNTKEKIYKLQKFNIWQTCKNDLPSPTIEYKKQDLAITWSGYGDIMVKASKDWYDNKINEEKYRIIEKELLNKEIFNSKIIELLTKNNLKLPITPKQLNKYAKKLSSYTKEGLNINSDFLNKSETKKAKKQITDWLSKNNLGKKAVNYKLRDWVFSRQHYWGEPIPIVKCEKCGNISLEKKDLPLELPNVKNYEPTDTGESPLAKIDKWVNVKCPKCNGNAKRETDTMPNWAGSSWYFLRYIDSKNNKEFASPEKLKYWMPVDLYNGGMEHTTLHLLYSRFWHKLLYDLNYVNTAEPYKKRRSHGMILAEDGQKMSKSRGNVVNPDEVIKQYGADTVRLYEMFMGPYGDAIPWSTSSLIGMNRFLERVWNMQAKVGTQNFVSSGKDKTILIATNNKGKLKELKDHLKNFNIISLKNINKKIEEPEENGKTFEENSLIKARYYAQKTGYLTIADDSGLCVNALNDRPGVFSSRYAQGDYKNAHQKLLEELKNKKDRSAYLQSTVTLYNPKNNQYEQFEGRCEGNILDKPRGTGGFGYDPIFIPENLGKSFGECSLKDKYKYDHRKKAVDKLMGYLNKRAQNFVPLQDKSTERLLHQTIKKVTEDIENLKFNTAISSLMILLNELDKQKTISNIQYSIFLILLSPFAPHITEELWKALENKESIHLQKWPKHNPELTKEKEIVLVIQINGKVRDQIKVPADISEEEAKKIALGREKIKKWIEGKKIRKIIFVKGKLVNVVV